MRSTHVKKNQCLTTLSILNVSGFLFHLSVQSGKDSALQQRKVYTSFSEYIISVMLLTFFSSCSLKQF